MDIEMSENRGEFAIRHSKVEFSRWTSMIMKKHHLLVIDISLKINIKIKSNQINQITYTNFLLFLEDVGNLELGEGVKFSWEIGAKVKNFLRLSHLKQLRVFRKDATQNILIKTKTIKIILLSLK